MSGRLQVDLSSGVPPYEQIRGQVAALVAAGVLARGERLPTVRDLANDLGVAVGTVQRAYRELEAGGVVVSRRRVGTVVAATTAAPAGTTRARRLAQDFIIQARATHLSDDEILDLVRGALMSASPSGPSTSPTSPATA